MTSKKCYGVGSTERNFRLVLEFYREDIHTGLNSGATRWALNPVSVGTAFKIDRLLSCSAARQARRTCATAMGFSYSLLKRLNVQVSNWVGRRAQAFWWDTRWRFMLHELYLPSGSWGSLFPDLSLIMECFKYIISSIKLIKIYLLPWKLSKHIS